MAIIKGGKTSTFEEFMKHGGGPGSSAGSGPCGSPGEPRRRTRRRSNRGPQRRDGAPRGAVFASACGGRSRRRFAGTEGRKRQLRRSRGGVAAAAGTRTIAGLDEAPTGHHRTAAIASSVSRRARPGEDRLDIFLQQVINGLTLGSVYAVVALGYTMVYGIIQLINFAHGEVVMIGAMVAFSVITALAGAHTGLPPFAILLAGVLVAIPACMGIGYTLERVAYRPLRKAPRLAPLITAIGLSIILQHLAMIIWSRNPIPFPQIITVTPHPPDGHPQRRDDHQCPGRDHRHVGADDGRTARARLPHQARHRDARDVAEPAGRGTDGHQHQHRDRADVRDRRRARGDGRA